jgi:hypothetical protein
MKAGGSIILTGSTTATKRIALAQNSETPSKPRDFRAAAIPS